MLASGVKQHSFRGPKPIGSSTTKSKRYASLSGLFKSDSCTSLQDIVIATKPKPRQKLTKHRETTVVPLLGRDGSTAALVPEAGGRSSTAKENITDVQSTGGREFGSNTLRFPLLSPTRQESMLFFRMKTMQKAAQLAARSLDDGFGYSNNAMGSPTRILETPRGNIGTRGNTRGRTSVELAKVPPTRERQMQMEKHNGNETRCEIKSALKKSAKKKREKIIISSKYGYHSRSNSATFKRLNRARTKMDNLLKSQVVKFSSKSELPDLEQTRLTADTDDNIDSREGIPIRKERSHLPFNLDTNVYETFKESKDLTILYKKTIKSGKSNKSNRSSAKSLTIVLPKVEREQTTLSSLPTERTDNPRPTTPYTQYVEDNHQANGIANNVTANRSQNEIIDLADRPSTSEDKVPLSLEALTTSEFHRNASRNGTILPDIRRSITFDNSHPASPKKRSRKGKKPRPTVSNGALNQVSFLLDDSKSLTPSPTKTKRPYRQKTTPLGTITSFESDNMTTSAKKQDSRNSRPESKVEQESLKENRNEKHQSRSSSRFSEGRKNYKDTPPIPPVVKEQILPRQIISPPVLNDSDEDLYDGFENI